MIWKAWSGSRPGSNHSESTTLLLSVLPRLITKYAALCEREHNKTSYFLRCKKPRPHGSVLNYIYKAKRPEANDQITCEKLVNWTRSKILNNKERRSRYQRRRNEKYRREIWVAHAVCCRLNFLLPPLPQSANQINWLPPPPPPFYLSVFLPSLCRGLPILLTAGGL